MAASISTKNRKGRMSAAGQSSVKKTAVPTEMGSANNNAKNEETKVPYMNAATEKVSVVGLQDVVVKKAIPI